MLTIHSIFNNVINIMNAFNLILYLVMYLHIVVDCVKLLVEVRVVLPLYSAVGSGQVKIQAYILYH